MRTPWFPNLCKIFTPQKSKLGNVLKNLTQNELNDANPMKAIVPRYEFASTSGLTSVTYLDDVFTIEISNTIVTTLEIFLGKTLNINIQLNSLQQQELLTYFKSVALLLIGNIRTWKELTLISANSIFISQTTLTQFDSLNVEWIFPLKTLSKQSCRNS